MRKCCLPMASLLMLLSVFVKDTNAQTGQFKVRNDAYIQLGYDAYKTLTFGTSTATPNNGNFALEYCANCTSTGSGGFNIWKPWPTANAANFLIYIRDNGNVGIGNIGDASAKLWVSGNIKAVTTTYFSDLRFKENVKQLSSSLDNILRLKPCQYTFVSNKEPSTADSLSVNISKTKGSGYDFDNNLHFGLIAQDVAKIFPNLVSKDEQGYLSLNYTELIPIMINAIQEQNEKIKKLEELVITLKK